MYTIYKYLINHKFAVHSYKLRLSPHYLTVETGRYNNIPFERRLCFFMNVSKTLGKGRLTMCICIYEIF